MRATGQRRSGSTMMFAGKPRRHGAWRKPFAMRAVVLLAMLVSGFIGAQPAAGEPAAPNAPKPVNIGAPTLTGTPAVGQTLTCSPGVWAGNPNAFAFAWLRNGVAIVGQSAATYVVQSADQGDTLACAVTASNGGGEYTIVGLASGSYKVQFFGGYELNTNYLPQYFNGKLTLSAATAVGVTAGATTSGVNAALAPGGEIAGVVTNTAHASIADVSVCAGATGSGFSGNCAETNAAGEYTIVGLASGSYTISFAAGGCSEEEGGCVRQNYLSQYYSGKATSSEANPVTVTAGAATTGVDAELQTAGQVTGHVVSAGTHAPLANIEVCASEGSEGFFGACATTNTSGEYTISGLASGSYDIEFANYGEGNYAPQFYPDKPKATEAEPIAVSLGTTTSGIDGELQAGGQIAGTVTAVSGGAPISGIQVCAESVSTTLFFGAGACATTDASGEYTVSNLASGSYKVRFSMPFCGFEGCGTLNYVSQYYNDQSSSSAATEVAVLAGSTESGIDAALATGGSIGGVVTDAAHVPIANVEVCAGQVGGSLEIFDTCTTTSAAGAYTIGGLESGSYAVAFYPEETCNQGGCVSQNYVAQYYSGASTSATATPVTVVLDTTTAGINAELQPGGQITGRVTNASNGLPLAGIEVCAESIAAGLEGLFGGCANTNGPASGTGAASSNGLQVPRPSGVLRLAKKPRFDAKHDTIDFFFDLPSLGILRWQLSFQNSDIGFAASLGVALGDVQSLQSPAAQAARHKAKRCKRGYLAHHAHCVRATVPFAHGSMTVHAAGQIEVKVRAGKTALRALKAGRTLHVSGVFGFLSVAAGSPAKVTKVSVKVLARGRRGHGGKKRR